jgi:hypothetical protein
LGIKARSLFKNYLSDNSRSINRVARFSMGIGQAKPQTVYSHSYPNVPLLSYSLRSALMLKGINPRVLSVILIVVVIAVGLMPLSAMAANGPAGTWIGELRTPDGETVIVLTLDDSTGDWVASLEEASMGYVKATNLNVTNTQVMFTFKPDGAPFPAHFTGFYAAGEDRVTGTISQRGASRFIKFHRDFTSTIGVPPLPPGQEPVIPPPVRHDYNFAVTGRLSQWFALHMVKDENYNMNNLTSSSLSLDLAVKYYPLDGFNVFVRGFRGGQNFGSEQEKLDRYTDIGLNADSFLTLDGFEFGVMGYFGNLLMRDSRFNPYLTGSVGTFSWELTESGRGTDILAIEEIPLEGSGVCMAAGLGTEYKLNEKMNLELDFMWRYFPTADDLVWEDPDNYWSSTHVWSMSFGLSYGF